MSKTTVAKYCREKETEIDAARFAQAEEFAMRNDLLRQARLERLHKDLDRVEEKLESVSLDSLTPAELIRIKTTLLRSIKQELGNVRLLTSSSRRETDRGSIIYDNQYLELDK